MNMSEATGFPHSVSDKVSYAKTFLPYNYFEGEQQQVLRRIPFYDLYVYRHDGEYTLCLFETFVLL